MTVPANRRTGLVWHESYMWHNTGNYAGVMPYGGFVQPGEHAENPETKRRLKNLIDVSGLGRELSPIDPVPVPLSVLQRVHPQQYVDRVRELSAAGYGDAGMMAPIGHGSFEIALLSAGGVVGAVEEVVCGRLASAYALVRPPGHHAEPARGMGFCLFSNAAIGGRYALDALGLSRVAFVDWDVHHGNGTQAVFYDSDRALTISIHQHKVFPPDSGFMTEEGEGAGKGFNFNIPLPPGSGVGAYQAVFDRLVVPALREYRPELIIVPSGFDAGAFDPLGRMMLHSEAYRALTLQLMGVADELCDGRIVMTHEGGYNAPTVPFMGLAVLEALSGCGTGVEDPFLPLFVDLGYQELQAHQEAVIVRGEALLRINAPRWRQA